MNNARTTIPATPTPPQDKHRHNEAKASDNKTSLSDLAQVTRLYELGLVSKEQVQKIIAQVCSDNKKGAYLALIYCSGFALIYCSGRFASYFFHLIRSNVSCNLYIYIYSR